MKYVKLLLLHCEHILEHKSRSFVWFLVSLFGPVLFLLFWIAANKSTNASLTGWNVSFITSYYFLLIVASSLLMAHIEEDVALEDIYEGGLAKYLLRPFSYYWIKFFQEIPYRLLQGCYGILICIVFVAIIGKFFAFSNNSIVLLLSIFITILAYFLIFTYKMILGLLAFWVTDTRGLFQVTEVILLIFAGFVIPIEIFPSMLRNVAEILPFSYMIYFPIVSFQGKLLPLEQLSILGIQIMWLGILLFVYTLLWRKGVKKFTGVGL